MMCPHIYRETEFSAVRVRIPLVQHIGAPAIPVVKSGSVVRKGDVIGEIPEGKLGARVHASIDGIVTLHERRNHHRAEIIVKEKHGRNEFYRSD